jgi:hypothetical protein
MATKWKMKRADSLWLDVVPDSATSIDTVDATWPGTWSGKFTVKNNLTDADADAILADDLVLFDGANGRPNTPGQFRLTIDSVPTNGTPIPNGTYELTVEIYNGLTGFRKEVAQHQLVVSQEGVIYVAP